AARAGLVMFNKPQDSIFDWIFGTPDLEYYRKAATMSAAKYGIQLAEDPIFVTWAMNSDSVEHSLWPQARNFWLLTSLMALPICATASALAEVLSSLSVPKGYVPFFEK
ncbi:Ank2, partial [Symbiodinium pilosum]